MTSKIPVTIKRDMEALDATILHDFTEDPETFEDSNYPCGYKMVSLFAIGYPQDLSAGLRGSSLTPYFKNLADLYTYWYENRKRIICEDLKLNPGNAEFLEPLLKD